MLIHMLLRYPIFSYEVNATLDYWVDVESMDRAIIAVGEVTQKIAATRSNVMRSIKKGKKEIKRTVIKDLRKRVEMYDFMDSLE